MAILAILFGLLGGCLLSVLVGIVGSRRNIGFGWAFLLSVIFTPLIGLLFTLLSDPLPGGTQRWGCLGMLLAAAGFFFLLLFLSMFFAGGAVLATL